MLVSECLEVPRGFDWEQCSNAPMYDGLMSEKPSYVKHARSAAFDREKMLQTEGHVCAPTLFSLSQKTSV